MDVPRGRTDDVARSRGALRLSMTTTIRVRTVALPIEHGAWGFWLEPALLGLLVAASPAGVALVVAALAALLLQTPLSIALTDRRRGRAYPRTALAWRWALGYGALLLAAGVAALLLASSWWVLVPVVMAAPLALGQLWFDAQQRAREALPEVLGALAMGSLVAAVALAAGWTLGAAIALWALLAARTVPAIMYVRARLRLERGAAVSLSNVLGWHLAALAIVSAGIVTVGGSWWFAAPYVVLLVRATLGLSGWRRRVAAKVVGFGEIAHGLVTVALLAIAVRA